MTIIAYVCDYHKTRPALPHETCVCGFYVTAQVGRNAKRQDAEERLDAQHESAVAKGDAP